MKVLFITRKFPPIKGGMELFARDLSSALSDKVDLKLVAWTRKARGLGFLAALAYLFFKSLKPAHKTEIIQMQDGVLAPLGWLLSRLFGKPYVVIIHGLEVTYTSRIYQATVLWAIRKADLVICISSATADAAKARGVSQSKIHILPLAVNDDIYKVSTRRKLLEQLNLSHDCQLLLSVGRLVKRKGVAWFIDSVLPDLVAQFPKIVYLVAGDGPERTNIEAVINKNKLSQQVRLLGKVEPELLAAAYNAADVFVMPNISVPGDVEGFGLVLLEASLCARPIVASNFEGIKDALVNGQSGILVPPGSARQFKDSIANFLSDPKAAARFGQASRHYTLQNYQWKSIAEQYVHLYTTLLRTS